MAEELLCRADGLTSTGVDYGLCGLPESDHVTPCPRCGGYGEYEGEYGPLPCMGCLTGLGPSGHPFQPGGPADEALREVS